MINILIWFLAALLFIPRVLWANLAITASSLSPEQSDPPPQFLTSLPKKKKKSYNIKLSVQNIARQLQIGSIIPERSNGRIKNLMIYISPTGSFDNPRDDLKSNDAAKLIKVQIENSIALGWKLEDIELYTNFEYRYGELEAKVIPDVDFLDFKPQANKIVGLVKLFELGLIQNDITYWLHDLDAFQLHRFRESDLKFNDSNIILTAYGSRTKWNGASIFFKKGSEDIFSELVRMMYRDKIDDEMALYLLSTTTMESRIKEINHTYCFQPAYNFEDHFDKATKPLKIVHFHPLIDYPKLNIDSLLAYFKGKNEAKTPLITDSLSKIFRYHRIT